jgi:hypothetical protein
MALTIGGGFIKEMQNILRLEEARQESAQAAINRDANVRETVGPAQWQALKTSVLDGLERINAGFSNRALVYQEDGNSFTISNQIRGRPIVTEFDPPTCQISYRGVGGSGIFRANVISNMIVFLWEITEPCKGVERSPIRFTDADGISIEKIAEVLIRCVVLSGD